MALQGRWNSGGQDSVSFITEREIRVKRFREQVGGLATGGRCPDGLMIRNGVRIGIEVERTAKRSVIVKRIAAAWLPYLGEGGEFRGVLWLVPSPRVAERYEAVFAALSAADVFQVRLIDEVIA
jgi:hypothetical protein